MDEENYKRRLESLVKELTALQTESNPPNSSYEYLITELTDLSYPDLKKKKNELMYFLVDSYNGDKKTGDSIGEFIGLYCREKKK